MNKKILGFLLLAVTFVCFGQYNNQESLPDRIILNLTENPATSIAITWRTYGEVKNPKVQYTEAEQYINFVNKVKSADALSEVFVTENKRVTYHHSAVINNLLPGEKYVYRVGADSIWSEWNQFNTADQSKYNFEFIYFGDPQDGIREHISRVFRQAYKTVPDARFWLFAGDITSTPDDYLWEELFYALGFIPKVTPSIYTPGNHDYQYITVENQKEHTKKIGSIWNSHFTLPENGIDELKETSYYIDYQGVRIIMLNSNEKLEEQSVWLDKLLANNPNKWTIAVFHHPVFSAGRTRKDNDTKTYFKPLFDKYHVDLVLQGHDHTYARSYKIKNESVVSNSEQGTYYVVSSCGAKSYPINPLNKNLMAKMGNEVQLFQRISVSEKKLIFNSYTVNGQIYDSFEINK